MTAYKIIHDPLNGYKWQVRVLAYPDGVTPLWCDAGDACESESEAVALMAEFQEGEK